MISVMNDRCGGTLFHYAHFIINKINKIYINPLVILLYTNIS